MQRSLCLSYFSELDDDCGNGNEDVNSDCDNKVEKCECLNSNEFKVYAIIISIYYFQEWC